MYTYIYIYIYIYLYIYIYIYIYIFVFIYIYIYIYSPRDISLDIAQIHCVKAAHIIAVRKIILSSL